MPEYPDIENYVAALHDRIDGLTLVTWRFLHPFLLRTVEPSPEEYPGRKVVSVERQEKRIILGFEDDLYAAIHLMVAGRLQWTGEAATGKKSARPPRAGKGGTLLEAHFSPAGGVLRLTEAGSRRMAAVHLVRGRDGLAALHRGGLELFACTKDQFAQRLRAENHTIKRALTDPRMLSGVGNAYSDEILHAARMSPFRQTGKMTDAELETLFDAARATLEKWRTLLEEERAGSFPERVTAFHPRMAVHGRYGEPCPVCGTHVQRVRYAENECNYCPTCQTEGAVYADRALSRLLKNDWPRTVEELEKAPGIRY